MRSFRDPSGLTAPAPGWNERQIAPNHFAPRPEVCREPGCVERVTDDATLRDLFGQRCPAHVADQRLMMQADRVHDMEE